MIKKDNNVNSLEKISKSIVNLNLKKNKNTSYVTDIKYSNSKSLFDVINNFITQCIEDTQKIFTHLATYITINNDGNVNIVAPPPPPPPPLDINDNTFGNLINNLMNNLANMKNIRDFIFKYIYEIFKYYVLIQHTDNNFIVFCNSLNTNLPS